MTERTVLDELREREKDMPLSMYACYRVGHALSADGLCYCCLRRFPLHEDGDGSFDTSKPIAEGKG